MVEEKAKPKEKGYTIIRSEPVRRLSRDGEPYLAQRFYAESPRGRRFYHEVPEDKLDEAPALLTAKAKQLDAV